MLPTITKVAPNIVFCVCANLLELLVNKFFETLSFCHLYIEAIKREEEKNITGLCIHIDPPHMLCVNITATATEIEYPIKCGWLSNGDIIMNKYPRTTVTIHIHILVFDDKNNEKKNWNIKKWNGRMSGKKVKWCHVFCKPILPLQLQSYTFE